MDFIDKTFNTFSKANCVELNLRGEISEEEEKSILPSLGAKKNLTLWDIEKILTGIENNPNIKGLLIKISDLQIGFARANLIRSRLLNLRNRGKIVVTYIESGGNIEYLIATGAQKIYIAPWTMLNLIGLKAEVTFYKDALDKIGVLAHMKGFGEYKSASETFTRSSMSEPHKEMINSIIGDLEEQLELIISESRKIGSKELRAIIDNGPYMADSAKEHFLVDDICYEDALENKAAELLDLKISIIKAGNFLRSLNVIDKIRSIIGKFTNKYPIIALVADSGMITLGSSRGTGPVKSLGSESLNELLDKVSKNRQIKALVFRVLSPGGSAIASDLICKKLKEISDKKPVIISMSDVAASGGYLISLGGHKIVADSMTITGSIGIVSGKFDLSGLYEKLGITKEYVVKAKNALMFSSSKGFSADEEKKLLDVMQYYYKQFVSRVSESRKMVFEEAEKISRGRVWTGKQAKDIGLIDQTGGLDTALNIAAAQAQLPDHHIPVVKFYSEHRGIQLQTLLNGSFFADQFTQTVKCLNSLEKEKALTIMPFDLKLK